MKINMLNDCLSFLIQDRISFTIVITYHFNFLFLHLKIAKCM